MSTMTQRLKAKNTFMVSGLGTAMEYYDFSIYGLAAALIFPAVFFPDLSPLVGSLVAFSAFGVGFIVRPLGGIILGHLGDRIGRRPVMVFTLIAMGVGTFLIGCLPGANVLGSWAAVALVLLRIVQGFAAGGEWGGAAVIGIEAAPEGRRGLWGSFTSMGVGLGTLLGVVAFTIVSAFEGGDMTTFGWRIPFWLGGILVIIGLIARLRMPAEEPLENQAATDERAPLVEALRQHPRQITGATLVSFGWNSMAYVISVFLLSYAAQHGYSQTLSLTFQIISAVALLLGALFFGHLSDRFGRRRVMSLGGIGMVVMFFAFFPLANAQLIPLTALLFFVVGLIASAAQGPLPALIGEQFPARMRYSATSFSYQVGAAVGGGTASSIATALLIWGDGNPIGVSIYASAAALVLVVGTLLCREKADRPELTGLITAPMPAQSR